MNQLHFRARSIFTSEIELLFRSLLMLNKFVLLQAARNSKNIYMSKSKVFSVPLTQHKSSNAATLSVNNVD